MCVLPLSISWCLWRKKPIWLPEPVAFSSAGKRAAGTVIASLELRACGEPVFFVLSKHKTLAQYIFACLPSSPASAIGKHNSLLVCCSLFCYCRMYLPWPSCYSQAHTLTVNSKLDTLLNFWLARVRGHPAHHSGLLLSKQRLETAPNNSQSVSSQPSTPDSCLPALLLHCLWVKLSIMLIIPLESAATTRKDGEIREMAGFGANYPVKN